MSSSSIISSPSVDRPDDDVLVRVEGVSKKFCRSLKKSLWYGVCDIGAELNPFRRRVAEVAGSELLVASGNTSAVGGTGAQGLRGGRVPQLGPQGFAGRENSEPNRAAGASGPVTPAAHHNSYDDELREGEFYAVKDVSFELRRGECLGLIGHNGAGKTTLLKMLNGLIKPDAGSITMRGRVGALIALGAGFNPILTGRENIYINASVLGLTKKEIDAKIDEIIDFAEIREFIDTPVQNYSSGMQVRLGFAVATTLEPDILILDEVLAVGDAAFRAKCYNKIGKIQHNAAVIFVSHSMQQVSQVCSQTLLINAGRMKWLGDVGKGIAEYNKESNAHSANLEKTIVIEPPVRKAELTFSKSEISYGDFVVARLDLDLEAAMPGSSVRIPFYSPEGLVVGEWGSKKEGIEINLPAGYSVLEITIGPIHFGPGDYQLAFVLNDSTGVYLPFWSLKNNSLRVLGDCVGACEYQIALSKIEQYNA